MRTPVGIVVLAVAAFAVAGCGASERHATTGRERGRAAVAAGARRAARAGPRPADHRAGRAAGGADRARRLARLARGRGRAGHAVHAHDVRRRSTCSRAGCRTRFVVAGDRRAARRPVRHLAGAGVPTAGRYVLFLGPDGPRRPDDLPPGRARGEARASRGRRAAPAARTSGARCAARLDPAIRCPRKARHDPCSLARWCSPRPSPSLAAPSAGAYGTSAQTVGSQVLPQHWRRRCRSTLTVDNGPTDILGEIDDGDRHLERRRPRRRTRGDRDHDDAAPGRLHQGQLRHRVGQPERRRPARRWSSTRTARILTRLGLAPASVNGFGLSGGDDPRRRGRDQRHVPADQRLAHELRPPARPRSTSSATRSASRTRRVGFAIGKDGALSPELERQVPTMHPFSIATNDRQSLEADDEASLSELYPEPQLHDHDGHDHRHGDALRDRRAGARRQRAGDQRRRSVDPAHARDRLRRQDGRELHDQRRPARRLRRRRRAAGGRRRLPRRGSATFTRVDTDFTQEYLNKTKESDCAQDTDPNDKESIPVGASGTKTADFKVEGASLALVDRRHGQHGPRDRRHQDRASRR